jgi:hypothetical protein
MNVGGTAVDFSPIVGDCGALWTADMGLSVDAPAHPALLAEIRRVGAVLLRGFNIDVERFKNISDGLCRGFMSYAGGSSVREMIDGDATTLNVAAPEEKIGLPLHGEMHYTRHRPDVLLFCCLKPAPQGGETTIADGRELYRKLPDSMRRLFEERGIKYVRSFSDGQWQQMFQTNDIDGVEAYCRANGLTCRVTNDRTVVTEYVSRAISIDAGGEPVFIHNIFTTRSPV